MAILKIEVVEGTPDIVYKNPYDQVVIFADSPERLKMPDALANCLVVSQDETINFHGAKCVYFAVPEWPFKHIDLEEGAVEKNWRSAEAWLHRNDPAKK